jgi:hypothetical protein
MCSCYVQALCTSTLKINLLIYNTHDFEFLFKTGYTYIHVCNHVLSWKNLKYLQKLYWYDLNGLLSLVVLQMCCTTHYTTSTKP